MFTNADLRWLGLTVADVGLHARHCQPEVIFHRGIASRDPSIHGSRPADVNLQCRPDDSRPAQCSKPDDARSAQCKPDDSRSAADRNFQCRPDQGQDWLQRTPDNNAQQRPAEPEFKGEFSTGHHVRLKASSKCRMASLKRLSRDAVYVIKHARAGLEMQLLDVEPLGGKGPCVQGLPSFAFERVHTDIRSR